jgi:hypothetical protein
MSAKSLATVMDLILPATPGNIAPTRIDFSKVPEEQVVHSEIMPKQLPTYGPGVTVHSC